MVRLALPLLLLAASIPAHATAGPTTEFTKNGVTVTLRADRVDDSVFEIVATFTPEKSDPPLHLYSKDLAEGGTGFPTKVTVATDAPAVEAGLLEADKPTHKLADLEVYPDGPVTLRLAVELKPGAPANARIPVLLTYMACTERSCLIPVIRQRVAVALAEDSPPDVPPTAAGETAMDPRRFARLIADEVARQVEERTGRGGIHWHHPLTVIDAEAVIEQATRDGKASLLDFTGPSCVNCQQMEKTVFLEQSVVRAWNASVPIKVNTDPPYEELADWQNKRFGTQNRPLYVVIGADGTVRKWSEVFAITDRAAVERYVRFLEGGEGSDAGTGSSIWEFLVLAVLGGLFTLVMPCTYPMIPLTVSVFAKQQRAGRRLFPLAFAYASGIVASFTAVGIAITGFFGSSLSSVSGHPVTNLVIAILFVVLGLSLLDVFFLQVPSGIVNRVGGAKMGYAGALFMGFAFAITSFTCTAPFAGSVLSQGVATGNWAMPVVGMVVYSSAVAIPFFLLALSPTWVAKLPKADSWMHEFKVIGALIEIGAGMKFLAVTDADWGWGIVRRGPVLALWAAIAFILAMYVMGKLRTAHDAEVPQVNASRLLLACCFATLGFWLLHGLAGGSMGIIESFFPGDPPPRLS